MLIVLTYTKRYDCEWQIIELDGTVLSRHKTMNEAKEALRRMHK